MPKNTKLINILKALFVRVVIIAHIIVLYMAILWEKQFCMFTLVIIVGVIFLIVEGFYNILVRNGQEWKWGSPLIFVYIATAYLPSLIKMHRKEFDSTFKNNQDKKGIFFFQNNLEIQAENAAATTLAETVNNNKNSIMKSVAFHNANMEIFFLIVLITRWCMPKGKISIEELSRLLLFYMSVICDILDMNKMVKHLAESKCEMKLKKDLFYLSLTALSVSMFQLCLGLTARRRTKTNVKNLDTLVKYCHKADEKKNEIKCNKYKVLWKNLHLILMSRVFRFFEKEVWGVVVCLLIKDIPFSILRTYALILSLSEECIFWNQSIFFTLKNYLTIIIQINRCYVIFNNSDEENLNEANKNDANNNNCLDHQNEKRDTNLTSLYSSRDKLNKSVSVNTNIFMINKLDDCKNFADDPKKSESKKKSWFSRNNKVSSNNVSINDKASVISTTDFSDNKNHSSYKTGFILF